MILFQAQIEEHQQLAQHYRELASKRDALAHTLLTVQQQAETDLSSLRDLVGKCKEVAPGAIASLKSAVLNLFSDGDDGNLPNDPTPGPDDDEPELLCLNGETGEALTTADIAADHPHKAELNGQPYEWSSPFADPLACLLWEDAPLLGQHCQLSSYWEHDWELEPLDGQAWEIASPLCCLLSDVPWHNKNKSTTEAGGMAYIELVTHSENKAIAYQRKHDGEIVCVYVGFRTKAIATSWMHFIEAITDRVELRQAKRMEGFRWEAKIRGMSAQQIERLANEAIDKAYRTEVNTAVPPTYKPRSIPQPVNPDEVGEGDIVTQLLTPSASYKIIQIMPNGILDCENLTTGVRLGIRPEAVTLVRKAEAEAVTVEPTVDPLTNILEVGDIVEVLEPPLKGQIGTVTGFNKYNELPLSVRTPGGEFGFKRHELKFISRPDSEALLRSADRSEAETSALPSALSIGRYSRKFARA